MSDIEAIARFLRRKIPASPAVAQAEAEVDEYTENLEYLKRFKKELKSLLSKTEGRK